MIVSHDFCCSWPGCKVTVHVHVTMHMHDDHAWDLEQLGRAIGFRWIQPVNVIAANRWQCAVHDAEAAKP